MTQQVKDPALSLLWLRLHLWLGFDPWPGNGHVPQAWQKKKKKKKKVARADVPALSLILRESVQSLPMDWDAERWFSIDILSQAEEGSSEA